MTLTLKYVLLLVGSYIIIDYVRCYLLEERTGTYFLVIVSNDIKKCMFVIDIRFKFR